MPKLTDLETRNIGGSSFKFSATRVEDLGASEYTLATVVVDVSGSVEPYRVEIEKALKEVVKSCRRSPRADNLMLRVVLFDDTVREVHGFKPLPDCNESDYDGCVPVGGRTALFDAAFSAIKATTQYGKELIAADFSANAAVFVITDGMDNESKITESMVAESIEEARRNEDLESIMPVLVGIGAENQASLNSYLEGFKDKAGFQQFVAIGDASEKVLAKLGGFISRSISSQSQALGTGGPSQSLTF